jgi:hypothetical protein
MTQKIKNHISLKEADRLFEKYYEGETTKVEEHLLWVFLQQANLPEKFEAERALFSYFAEEKQPLKGTVVPATNLWLRLNPVLRWSLAAAVLIAGVFILDNRIQAQNRNVAYVDGVRCTDSKEVTALALASIDQMDLESDEVAGTVDKMNDKDLVESQLQQFPELK